MQSCSFHFSFFLRNILILVDETGNINLAFVLLITCRWYAKSRQSLTFPAPDPEHAFEQLLQSLFQRHVSVHFHRALGTRGITHHRRLLRKKKKRKNAKRKENSRKRICYSTTIFSSVSRAGISEDQLVFARRKRWIHEDDDWRLEVRVECASAPWPTDWAGQKLLRVTHRPAVANPLIPGALSHRVLLFPSVLHERISSCSPLPPILRSSHSAFVRSRTWRRGETSVSASRRMDYI